MAKNISPYVFQLILHGTIQALETINVFYYAGSDPIITPNTTSLQFVSQVLSLWPGICNTYAHLDALVCNQVRGGVAFDSMGLDITGGVSGDGLPPFTCWDFTLMRGGVGERNGYKRIAGISENHQVNGVAVPAVVPSLTAFANAMGALLNVGLAGLAPVIRRTRRNHAVLSPVEYWDISGCLYARIGTQNSRKFGHGR